MPGRLILMAGLLIGGCGASPDALQHSKWSVAEIGGTAVVQGSRSTLEFTGDDRVAGNGGCNQYGGTAQIGGASLKFGPLISTRMACADAGAMHQESQLFAALDATRGYRKEGVDLLLTDEAGRVVVRLRGSSHP